MDQTFTLDELAQFTQHEKEQLNQLGLVDVEHVPHLSPKKSTVENILNYSKALSVKKSSTIGNVEMLLN